MGSNRVINKRTKQGVAIAVTLMIIITGFITTTFSAASTLVGLDLNQYIVNLDIGEKKSVKSTTNPADSTDKGVTWSSDNENVATVSQTGEINAIGAGTAIIKATSTANPLISSTCTAAIEVPTLLNMTFNGNPKTSIAFDWYTSPKTTGTVLQVIEKTKLINGKFPATGFVSYRGTGTVINTFMNISDRGYTSSSPKVIGNYTQFCSHKVIANNLKPGTLYAYRAGDGDAARWSSIGSFTTDSEDIQPFHFVVTTDTQGSVKNVFDLWADTFQKAIITVNPKFIALTGDMTDDGDIESTFQWFMGIPKTQFATTPFVPVFGSHETNDQKNPSLNFFYHYNLPKDVGIGYRTTWAGGKDFGKSYEDGSVYSFEYGNALFMVLNGQYEGKLINNYDTGKGISWVDPQFTAQCNWMKTQVANSDKKWKFVLIHKGPFSAGNNTKYEWSRIAFTRFVLTPLLNELKIDVVFEGHDHMYMRSNQMVGDQNSTKTVFKDESGNVIDPEGTLYLMSATAGSKYYTENPTLYLGDYFAAIDEQPSKKMFIDVSVTDEVLKIKSYTAALNEAVSVYDQYGIKKTLPIMVSKVQINKPSATLNVSGTLKLTAAITPVNATNTTVNWTSSNTNIAVVSAAGVVTAKAKGVAVITATTASGIKKSTCKITVLQSVKSVKLNKTSISLKRGKTFKLTATVSPANASNKKVTWKSGSTKIATVSSTGLIKAKTKGTVYISVYTVEGKKSARCKVIIK
ncbi:MAG: Ig-like domain-containing protein [Clostridia bacterium]|jgi:uncharacterized protein YjdB